MSLKFLNFKNIILLCLKYINIYAIYIEMREESLFQRLAFQWNIDIEICIKCIEICNKYIQTTSLLERCSSSRVRKLAIYKAGDFWTTIWTSLQPYVLNLRCRLKTLSFENLPQYILISYRTHDTIKIMLLSGLSLNGVKIWYFSF